VSDTIFEKSVPGRKGYTLPRLSPLEAEQKPLVPEELLADCPPELPSLSELDVVRHFTNLSRRNMGVDGNFYPLGSCTMKYNPKINEKVAGLDGFTSIHPSIPRIKDGAGHVQGALKVLYESQQLLCEIVGMDAFTLQPMAGANGELTGIMLIAAYHRDKGNKKTKVIIPDSAHGTNPSSAAIAGFDVVTVPSGPDGHMDMKAFEEALDDDTAAVMLTCPNTLGLFDPNIHKIAEKAHAKDALLYYDGANLNALLGRCRVGDLGFDVVHLNLHKTFSTPHGGGGPGAGPVGVKKTLAPYLPTGIAVKKNDGIFDLDYNRPKSIGRVAPFFGNFGVVLNTPIYSYRARKDSEGSAKTPSSTPTTFRKS